MKIHEPVAISVIQEHLKARRSGVSLDLQSMPGLPSEYTGFRAELSANDVSRLILWFQFEKHTRDENCSLDGLLPSAADLDRVKSFVNGDVSKRYDQLDLRSASAMELVLVSDDALNGFLYVIDGNHRVIAQSVRQLPFQDVPVFVCVHPEMRKWAYIPMYYKRLWKL